MVNKLKEFCDNGKNVSLYLNRGDTTRFVFGRIVFSNDRYVIISMISPAGRYDGYLVKSIDDIVRLEFDDLYSDRMQKLCSAMYEEVCFTNFDSQTDDPIRSFLKKALDENKVISIELIHSNIDDVVGNLVSIQDDLCMVKQIDQYGCEDGYSVFSINNITHISYDSEDEQIIMRLREAQKT